MVEVSRKEPVEEEEEVVVYIHMYLEVIVTNVINLDILLIDVEKDIHMKVT